MRKILFYKNDAGECPVEEFLDSLSAKQAQKVAWVMEVVEEIDLVPKQYLKKLKNTNDIWEIRVINDGNIFRILGFPLSTECFIVTNGFHKKTEKTPKSEIRLAEKYKQNYLKRLQP
jgi:phage-related protein